MEKIKVKYKQTNKKEITKKKYHKGGRKTGFQGEIVFCGLRCRHFLRSRNLFSLNYFIWYILSKSRDQ